MAAITQDFEAGVNGNTITTGAGEASATKWDAVVISSGETITYDTTHVAHGSLACKLTSDATVPAAHLDWTTQLGTVTDHYGRIYIYLTANPSALIQLFQMGTSSGGVRGFRMDINTNGTLRYVDGSASVASTTNSIGLNQWVRIEWHTIHSATVGQIEIKLFNSADSAAPTETLTSAANLNTLANANGMFFGAVGGPANTTFWFDQIVEKASAYPGPFPVSSVAPAITGSAPVGSTLTCDGGTWNGTFTLGYQWTRDGANIAAATSSTYLTQAGDATHAIGCTVTATGQVATNESASTASSNTVTVTAAASDTAQPTGLSGQYVLLISGSN